MPVGWEWDETLFAGSAPYYERGRVPYAPGLAGALAEMLGTDGRGRLLDVGCGPGTIALRLRHLFAEVVGVDPDPGMIEEARRRDPAMTWVRARAEDLTDDLGTFTVATFAQSFHWMDRDLVAETVHRLLRPGGAFVHIADWKLEKREHPALTPPYEAIGDLVRRYLGPLRRAGQGHLPQGTPGGEAAILRAHGFAGPTSRVVPGGRVLRREVDDVVAAVFSRSDSAPHLFGDRLKDFEEDLAGLLREASPTGRFEEVQPSTEVFVWRRE